jgi:ferric-dicitrate binding protein FerR (iron transport regulator)
VSVQDETVEVLVTQGEVAVQGAAEESAFPGNASRPPPAPVPAVQAAATGEGAAADAPDARGAPAVAASEYRLRAGKRLVVGLSPDAATPEVVAMSPEDMNQRLGWRVPTLRFSRTPLRKAIALINRHSAGWSSRAPGSTTCRSAARFARTT